MARKKSLDERVEPAFENPNGKDEEGALHFGVNEDDRPVPKRVTSPKKSSTAPHKPRARAQSKTTASKEKISASARPSKKVERVHEAKRAIPDPAGLTLEKGAANAQAKAQRNKIKLKKQKSAKPSRGVFGWMRRLIYWAMSLALWGAIGVAVLIGFVAIQIPGDSGWSIPERPPNVRIVSVDGTLIGNRGATGGESVAFHQLPATMPQAIVAIEDHRFYNHFGFDPIGLARALYQNMTSGGLRQGGSTLTQQLAKNLFLTPERTLQRKVKELVLALWLEASYSKDEILELYLNRVYFGAGSYGVDAAARRYYNKSARDLTLGESATLAGLVQAPSRFAPNKHPERAAKRAGLVLRAMAREGYITEDQAATALTDTAVAAPTKAQRGGAQNYVADYVLDELQHIIGDVTSDIIVETTIDKHLQEFAQNALFDGLKADGETLGVSQGALVSMDGIGAVRALVGGRNYGESQYNRAVRAKRQPGSTFKAFVYLTAMEYGMIPETTRIDRPVTIKGWTPRNYSEKYFGPVSLQKALALSLNTVSATLADEIGPAYVVEAAQRLGIGSKLTANPSISLGTSEVTPLELANAYVPFANGGFRVKPFVVRRITDTEGQVLYELPAQPDYARVIEPQHLGMMNAMLKDALETGTGKRAKLDVWPAAGKTGTSQDFRDAWFAGFTSNLTTIVWVGNDDNSPTKKATGGNLPAQVWRVFMNEAHQGLSPQPLPGSYTGTEQRQVGQDQRRAPRAPQQRPRNPLGGFLDRLFGG